MVTACNACFVVNLSWLSISQQGSRDFVSHRTSFMYHLLEVLCSYLQIINSRKNNQYNANFSQQQANQRLLTVNYMLHL
jgi:hypothetical protein